MTYEFVGIERTGHIATVTIQRPDKMHQRSTRA